MTPQLDLSALVARLATRSPARSEATVQADIRTLLLAAPLNLAETRVAFSGRLTASSAVPPAAAGMNYA